MEILGLALAIDLIIGDNLGRAHPVVLIGKYISFFEKKLNQKSEVRGERLETKRKRNKQAGVLLVLIVLLTSFSISFLLIKAFSFNKLLYVIVTALMVSTTFALRGLLASGFRIFRALNQQNIEKARVLLAEIVGRDTKNLNQTQIIKATIESLAENTIDSLIAPLFYALIGGPVLAVAYRSINTLDSMVGYKNEHYKDFGWASAKLDDVANFIPARLGLIFVWLATIICRLKFKETIKCSINEGPSHASPNSGLTEAAFAGALGVQLGGVAYYQGIARQLPTFGKNGVQAKTDHIKSSLILVATSSLLFFACVVAIKAVLI